LVPGFTCKDQSVHNIRSSAHILALAIGEPAHTTASTIINPVLKKNMYNVFPGLPIVALLRLSLQRGTLAGPRDLPIDSYVVADKIANLHGNNLGAK
jgi:hypothetical protein